MQSQVEVQKDAALIVASLNSQQSRVWVVVGGPWALEREDTRLTEPDLSFVNELQRQGFNLAAMNSTNTFGIRVYQRGAKDRTGEMESLGLRSRYQEQYSATAFHYD